MRIAYFDCHFGAAGDMLNAALLSAGLDEQQWLAELTKIALPESVFQVTVSDVMRCNLASKKMDVLDSSGVKFDQLYEMSMVQSASDYGHAQDQEHAHDHGHTHDHDHTDDHGHTHGHEHTHEHEHTHDHDHTHDPDHKHAHGHSEGQEHAHSHGHSHSHPHSHSDGHAQVERIQEHSHGAGHQHTHALGSQLDQARETRHLADILRLIERSDISTEAKDLSSRIFMRLANAESKVHGVAPDEVHFHEVGAVDAIVDIVGFAIGHHMLGIERAYCSAVAIGSGRVRTEHGIFPIPGPATMYLLEEAAAAIAPSDFQFECLTPTGAAILCEIAEGWGLQPSFERVSRTGYGAGTKDTPNHPNVCRVVIGEVGDGSNVTLAANRPGAAPLSHKTPKSTSAKPARFETETVAVVEANLDDLNPQTLAYAMERFFEAGALDVTVCPAIMKKGRSGQVLTIVCHLVDEEKLQELVLRETTSLGVRSYHARRLVAQRQWQTVKLKSGTSVRIKLGMDNQGNLINAQPEYEDCAESARAAGIPIKDVMSEAMQAYLSHDNSRE